MEFLTLLKLPTIAESDQHGLEELWFYRSQIFSQQQEYGDPSPKNVHFKLHTANKLATL